MKLDQIRWSHNNYWTFNNQLKNNFKIKPVKENYCIENDIFNKN